MSLFNTYAVTVKSNAIGNYTSADGSYTPGAAAADTVAYGSWQPASGKDQKALPEGKRSSSVYKFYTATKLKVADQIAQIPGDIVVSPLDGQSYELNSSGDYQNALIPHYRYLAVRVKETG